MAKLSAPGRYGDGGGLVLQISKWRTKSWLFRFERDGRERQMGLGPVTTLSLAEARVKATQARKLLLDGVDPIEFRKQERMRARFDAARTLTFQDAAKKYIAAHETSWRNEKHRAQWNSTLKTYAYPVLGNISVASVDVALVLKCVEPIWTAKTETAQRLRGRIESILDWATARGFRAGDNPARWRGHLDKLLPKPGKVRAVQHHPALPFSEIAAFMAELRTREGISAKALEFTILTAVRTDTTVGARWTEIDTRSKVWTIAGERMKGWREYRVPLSDRAIEILSDLPREADFVFPGARAKRPLSNMAMLELLRGMRPGLTVHGFRSTFRDWAAETTNYPNHVVEMALAHVISDEVEAAYRRGDLFEKRRRLMNDWAKYCARPVSNENVTGNVVRLEG